MNVKVCPKCGKQNDPVFVACAKCFTPIDNVPVTDETPVTAPPTPSTASVSSNSVARTIKIIAIIIYIGGFIGGFLVGKVLSIFSDGDFSFSVALVYWISAIVSGTLLLGFSEVIRLLHEINQKVK